MLDLPGLRRPGVIVWGLIAAAAAALRLIRLDHFSYWLDEPTAEGEGGVLVRRLTAAR